MTRGKVDCFGTTTTGRVRENNEDQFLIGNLTKSLQVMQSSLDVPGRVVRGGAEGQILLVADGLGGAHNGEVASQLAVQTLISYIINAMPWFFHLDEPSDADFREELKRAFLRCEERIETAMEKRPERKGMGTTLTAAYLVWPRLYVAHVGDSRCYLFRRDHLRQLTQDHSIAQQFIDSGAFAPEEVLPKWRNVLWNVIGGNSRDIDPELTRTELQLGDYLILCTDGLTRYVEDDELSEILDRDLPAKNLCEHLVERSLERGGADNVTVVAARFLDSDPPVHRERRVARQSTTAADAFRDTDPYIASRAPITVKHDELAEADGPTTVTLNET